MAGIQEIGPEAERRKTLRRMAITESLIKQLRSLDTEEATWRVTHERKAMHHWVDDRFDMLEKETLPFTKPRTPPPIRLPLPSGANVHIVRHHRDISDSETD